MSKQPPDPRSDTDPAEKLRQSQREYSAARPNAEREKRMFSGVRIYVCRRCQSNFKTGEGQPDARISGFGKCNACLGLPAGTQTASNSTT